MMLHGTSKLTAFMFSDPGVYFFEGFEQLTFLADGAWTVDNGTPARTSAHSFEGLYSLDANLTSPLISHVLMAGGGVGSVWFYDDPTISIPGFFSYLAVSDATHYARIGVNTNVSATKYVVGYTGLADTATGILRTAGWHQVEFFLDVNGRVNLMLDGTVFLTVIYTPDKISLGASGSNPLDGPLIYDNLILASIFPVKFVFAPGTDCSGWTAKAFDSNGALYSFGGLYTQASSGSSNIVQFFFLYGSASGMFYNVPLYFKIFDRGGKLRAILPWTNVSSGNIFRVWEVDFGRRGFPTVAPTATNVIKTSNSGKTESLFFHAMDDAGMNVPLISDVVRSSLNQWWSVAQKNLPYSVALNSDEAYAGVVKTLVVVGGDVYVDDARGCAAGQTLVIASSDHGLIEELTLTAVDTTLNKLTFSDGPNYAYPVGSTLRGRYFYPQVLSLDQKLPCTLSDYKKNLWTFNHQFRELLP